MNDQLSKHERLLQQRLRESEQNLSAEQLTQLRLGRERALQLSSKTVRIPLWIKSGGLIAATLLIALFYLPMHQPGQQTELQPGNADISTELPVQHTLDNSGLSTGGFDQSVFENELVLNDDIELLEELEFYLWIAEQQGDAFTG